MQLEYESYINNGENEAQINSNNYNSNNNNISGGSSNDLKIIYGNGNKGDECNYISNGASNKKDLEEDSYQDFLNNADLDPTEDL